MANGSADAATWTRIATGGNGLVTYYTDKNIRAEGKLLRVQLLYDYREEQENPDGNDDHHTDFLSTTATAFIDCADRRISIERVRNHEKNMGRGRVVGQSAPSHERKFQPLTEAPEDDALFKAICGRRRR